MGLLPLALPRVLTSSPKIDLTHILPASQNSSTNLKSYINPFGFVALLIFQATSVLIFFTLSIPWYIPTLATTPFAAILALVLGAFHFIPGFAFLFYLSEYEVDIMGATNAFLEQPTCDIASQNVMMQARKGNAAGLMWVGWALNYLAGTFCMAA